MQSEQQYSNLVYEYFLMRIQFQYYKPGDLLPSIDTLCRELSVSSQTVKSALQRLRTEGYIDMRGGRATKVIYQNTKEEARQCALQYFSRRIKGFQDLYQTSRLVIMPLLLAGFRRADEKDLAYLSGLADGTNNNDVLQFFCFVLQKTDNPLAMNLFWETSIYWGLLFLEQDGEKGLSDVNLMHAEMKHCVSLAGKGEWTLLHQELETFRHDSIGKAVDYLVQIISPAPDEEQIPFTWRIYRERPQLCYSLAAYLLHEIYIGDYRDAEFFPSYEKMAKKYDTSVSTIRRTVKILNQLGVVQSINGKGTRIFGVAQPCEEPDFKSPAIRRNLAFFVQSFELLVYSCEPVIRDFLTDAAPEQRQALAEKLEAHLAAGRCELSLWTTLLFITKHSRRQGIREIYGRIYSLILWSHPLKVSHEYRPALEQAILDFTTAMIRGLKTNDTGLCADVIKTLVSQQFPAAERYLFLKGFQLEDLRLSPAIRLLITQED